MLLIKCSSNLFYFTIPSFVGQGTEKPFLLFKKVRDLLTLVYLIINRFEEGAMAILSSITCMQCHKQKNVGHSTSSPCPLICDECAGKEKNSKKRKHLSALARLPISERLTKIEEFIYKHSQMRHSSGDGRIG
jgi:hypothetical protein